ncbi:MAG: hypothetical protein J7L91_04600 [Candidatus Korarchaeota archaeon]|nr:hypothetical protein [Candidatus Korarchaeota archaeon]
MKVISIAEDANAACRLNDWYYLKKLDACDLLMLKQPPRRYALEAGLILVSTL